MKASEQIAEIVDLELAFGTPAQQVADMCRAPIMVVVVFLRNTGHTTTADRLLAAAQVTA